MSKVRIRVHFEHRIQKGVGLRLGLRVRLSVRVLPFYTCTHVRTHMLNGPLSVRVNRVKMLAPLLLK